jgi:hypothetical protein
MIDEFTSLSTTYEIRLEGCDGSIEWCWRKFAESAGADKLTQPPAFDGDGVPWDITLRKDNNSIRILLREIVREESENRHQRNQGLHQ